MGQGEQHVKEAPASAPAARREEHVPDGRLPSVSAIIPAYNSADTIERALDSVYAQTYPNLIEVIVVDDGSTDSTAAAIQAGFPDVRVVEQSSAGVAAARNRGVREARGEYVAFLDSDDEWFPNRLERQLSVLVADPRIDFCACLPEVCTSTGRRVRSRPERRGGTVPVTFGGYLRREGSPLTCLPLGRRSDLLAVGGYDETLRAFEDLDLWLRVLAAGRTIAVLQEYLYRWYLRRESLSHGRQGLHKHDCALAVLAKWDPSAVPEAGELITSEEHLRLTRRALVLAARDYAYYGEHAKSRGYATRALGMSPRGVRERLLLRCLVSTPAAYRTHARAVAAVRAACRRLSTQSDQVGRSLARQGGRHAKPTRAGDPQTTDSQSTDDL